MSIGSIDKYINIDKIDQASNAPDIDELEFNDDSVSDGSSDDSATFMILSEPLKKQQII